MVEQRKPVHGSKVVAVLLLLFGLLTLFKGGSVLFDIGGAREQAGAVVLLVLWMNLLAAVLYLVAAVGLFSMHPWADKPLLAAIALLLIAAIGFFLHVQGGGAYEQRTMIALPFRFGITVLLYFAARYFVKQPQ